MVDASVAGDFTACGVTMQPTAAPNPPGGIPSTGEGSTAAASAGVGTAIVVLCALVVVVAILVTRRRREQKAESKDTEVSTMNHLYATTEDMGSDGTLTLTSGRTTAVDSGSLDSGTAGEIIVIVLFVCCYWVLSGCAVGVGGQVPCDEDSHHVLISQRYLCLHLTTSSILPDTLHHCHSDDVPEYDSLAEMPHKSSYRSSDVAENPSLYGSHTATAATDERGSTGGAKAPVYDTPPPALMSSRNDVAENPLVYDMPPPQTGARGRSGPEYDVPPPAPSTHIGNDYRDSVRELPSGYLDMDTGEEIVDDGPVEPLYDDGDDGDALEQSASSNAARMVAPAPRGLVRDASWRVMFGDQRRRSSIVSTASARDHANDVAGDTEEGC